MKTGGAALAVALAALGVALGEDAKGLEGARERLLEEDLAFIERHLVGRYRLLALSERVVASLRRSHPGQESRFLFFEARTLSARARAENDPVRRRALAQEARAKLEGIAVERPDAPLADALLSAEARFQMLRIDLDAAEAARSLEAFEAVVGALETLRERVVRLDDAFRDARGEDRLPAAAAADVAFRIYTLQAESLYEQGQALLAAGRTVPLPEQAKRALLARSAEAFDNAAFFTEPPEGGVIHYPAAYLGKAAAERAADLSRAARTTLEGLLARRIEHPDAARVRTIALAELADLAIAAKEWDRARTCAADLSRAGARDRAQLLECRIAVSAALFGRPPDGAEGPWRKPFDEGVAALAQLAESRSPVAQEAAYWREQYLAAVQPRSDSDTVRLTREGDEKRRLEDYAGALALYRQAIRGRDALPEQTAALWDRIAFCYFKQDRLLDAAAAWTQVVDHPAAVEEMAANAVGNVPPLVARWMTTLGEVPPAGNWHAVLPRVAYGVRSRFATRFPDHAESRKLLLDLAEQALRERNPARALQLFARVRATTPAERLRVASGSVSAHAGALLSELQEKRRSAPTAEEVEPIDAAYRELETWLASPERQSVPPEEVRRWTEGAARDAGFLLALARAERALAVLDAFAASLPAGQISPEWLVRFRCMALAGAGRAREARQLWGRLAPPDRAPSQQVQATAHALLRIASAQVRSAKAAGDEAAVRAFGGWVAELTVATVGVKENPTEEDLRRLLGLLRYQVQEGEYAQAIGIGELALSRKDAWKLPAKLELEFQIGLSDAAFQSGDWETAWRASEAVVVAYDRRNPSEFARWALERFAESARRAGEEARDGKRRKEAFETAFQAYSRLRQNTLADRDKWIEYAFWMVWIEQARGEHAFLPDLLRGIFRQEPSLGGRAWRWRFAEVAADAARRLDGEARRATETLLDEIWSRRAEAADPASARIQQ